jgi:transcriptional regulator PpsR
MEALAFRDAEIRFKQPETYLRELEPESIGDLIAASADIALVVDKDGVVRDISVSSEDLKKAGLARWVGQRWIDTVTVESRAKVAEMLEAARIGAETRWRQVNHPSDGSVDVPIRYVVRPIGLTEWYIVVGRDLLALSKLQLRLVEAQQSMEREYSRLRHAETRYRLLFQLANEPVIVVSATTQKIQEINPAALRVIGLTAERAVGRGFTELFDSESAKAIDRLFARLYSTGEVEPVAACMRGGDEACMVSASLFRREESAYYLVRLTLPTDDNEILLPKADSQLRGVMEGLPDGFVVTDLDLKVLTCNSAFLGLVQLATEEQVQGNQLERWLGRGSVDSNALSTSLREYGTVRNFGTFVRGEYGGSEDVEITAVSVPEGDVPCLGFIVRHTGSPSRETVRDPRVLPRSADQLAELVGRVPLKELVREATDVIEKMCIEASLNLTHNNRASAAQMLGLSRQSFYSKLRRYGLGDLDS